MHGTSPSRSRVGVAVACAGLAFLFAPLVLLGLGFNARPIENRSLTSWPDPGAGWVMFSQLDAALTDRLPTRQLAIRGDAWVDEVVFREEPAFGQSADPQVLRGAGGTLFLADDLSNACDGGVGPDEAISRWERFLEVIRGSGRPVVLLVVPDKSTVLGDRLRQGAPGRACAERNRKRLWRHVQSTKDRNWIDLRQAFDDVGRDGGEPLYFERDTHWTPYGAMLAVRGVARTLDPERWGSARLVRGKSRTYPSDLSRMLGRREGESAPQYFVQAAPPRPGRTLFIHDSFGNLMKPGLARMFTELRTANWSEAAMPALWKEVAASDVVIVETAERFAYSRPGSWLTDASLAELREAVRSAAERLGQPGVR